MKKMTLSRFTGLLIIATTVLSLAGPSMAQSKKSPKPAPSLKVGDAAPDFKMQYFDGKDLKDVSLGDFRGKKNVVLAFYIFAFTGG
jgi:hypothetical protein